MKVVVRFADKISTYNITLQIGRKTLFKPKISIVVSKLHFYRIKLYIICLNIS